VEFNSDVIIRMNADKTAIANHNQNLEVKIQNRTAELEETNKQLKQFAHVVSHDLKEPIRTVNTFIGLLEFEMKKKKIEDETLNEYLKFIRVGGVHATELIKSILNYSSTAVDKSQFTSIDLNNLVDMAKFQLKSMIQEKNATISHEHLLVITGEKLLIYQLLQNLISNAIRYTEIDRKPSIQIKTEIKDGNIILTVKDNGKGIPKSSLSSIFKPLVRLDTTDTEGTGMGLSIAQKIVEAHNGKIWVESEVGVGSTFFMTFPNQNNIAATNT